MIILIYMYYMNCCVSCVCFCDFVDVCHVYAFVILLNIINLYMYAVFCFVFVFIFQRLNMHTFHGLDFGCTKRRDENKHNFKSLNCWCPS